MREFRYYTETEPGLLLRRSPENCVRREAQEAVAPALKRHYANVWHRPETAPIRERHYDLVVSVGGGLPFLEMGLDAGCIVSLDPLAAEYAESAEVLMALWPDGPPMKFLPCGMTVDPKQLEEADLVVFCHVLEHMPLEDASAYLAAVPAKADILIYGPDADTMRNDGWWHAVPVHEHLWLAGLEWTAQWAGKAAGRPAAVAMNHQLDLLIWLPAGDASGGRGVADSPDPSTMRGDTAEAAGSPRGAILPDGRIGEVERRCSICGKTLVGGVCPSVVVDPDGGTSLHPPVAASATAARAETRSPGRRRQSTT